MKVLLDTHAFLWILADDPRLSRRAGEIFRDKSTHVSFSAVSLWEIGIKISLGKLKLREDWHDVIMSELDTSRIKWLPINSEHCRIVSELEFFHRDPFDRMLIAQALHENLSILSRDGKFSSYPVPVIW